MENVTIYNGTKVKHFENLEYEYVQERDDELVVKLKGKQCYYLDKGDYLYFKRTVFCDNKGMMSFNGMSLVKYEDSSHLIHATLPETDKIYLNENFYELKHGENGSYYIISCKTNHYLFAQDLATIGQEVYFKSYDGTILGRYTGIYPLNLFRSDMGAPSEDQSLITSELIKSDCIAYSNFEKTCGKPYEYIETKHYSFFPKAASNKEFILTDFNEFDCKDAIYIEFKYNPFYYYTENRGTPLPPITSVTPSDVDSHNKPVKHCYFYGDIWFDSFHDTTSVKYINDNPSINDFGIYKSYYSADIVLSSDSNESNLGAEDSFNESFADNIEKSLIPEFIDMERVKYVPYEKNGNNYFPITSITLYNHFRKRSVVDQNNNTNTLHTSGNVYYDGWYIDTDNNYNIYWNGYDGNGSNESITTFAQTNGKKSDLIGFLNFTDNDIYYRKSKVSKSFFRFYFYDSKDPIEQKLLYYSTVFLDSTELFCKFLKQKSFIEDSKPDDIKINEIANGNDNVKVVFCENEDVGCRLDSTIKITNEYDKSKCSEGFNIYLFSDDAPNGNMEKTIYMKIEFNHAGNGKTFPMFVLPSSELITIENFMDHLYIPIKIKKYKEKYIYTIENAIYDNSGDVKLCLFEAKLEDINQNDY